MFSSWNKDSVCPLSLGISFASEFYRESGGEQSGGLIRLSITGIITITLNRRFWVGLNGWSQGAELKVWKPCKILCSTKVYKSYLQVPCHETIPIHRWYQVAPDQPNMIQATTVMRWQSNILLSLLSSKEMVLLLLIPQLKAISHQWTKCLPPSRVILFLRKGNDSNLWCSWIRFTCDYLHLQMYY